MRFVFSGVLQSFSFGNSCLWSCASTCGWVEVLHKDVVGECSYIIEAFVKT